MAIACRIQARDKGSVRCPAGGESGSRCKSGAGPPLYRGSFGTSHWGYPGRRQNELIRSQKTGLMSLRPGVEPVAP